MQALIIGAAEKKELALLKERAEHNPFSAKAMRERIGGAWQPVNETLYTVIIPIEYKVVLTIEAALDARNPEISHGMLRHLSVSVAGEKKTPHPLAVQELMNELGFVKTLESVECVTWFERKGVINVIELI
jgi:hypothetical protein